MKKLNWVCVVLTLLSLLSVFGARIVYAQGSVSGVTVTTGVPSVSILVGSTASYGASATTGTPNPDKEWAVIGSASYSWSASLGTPSPNNASETTVTTGALNQAQAYTSKVTCTVSYQIQKSDPGQPDDGETSTISGSGSASVAITALQVSLSSLMSPSYVHLKGNYTDAFSTLNCQAQITPAMPGSTQSFSITLINPQHEVRFAGDTADSITLILTADGSAQPFDITGVAPSASVGEAVIQASSSNGYIVATMAATVFSFNSPSMTDTIGGNYALFYTQGGINEYYAPQGVAVYMAAQLTLQPVGLDPSAPEISPFMLGVQQNFDTPSSEKDTFSPPTVNDPMQWLPGSVIGETYSIPTLTVESVGKNYEVNDNDETNPQFPLYDSPVPFVAGQPTVDKVDDTPSTEPQAGFVTQTYSQNNSPIVTVRYYKVSSAHYQEAFHDWAVLCLYNGKSLASRINIAETTWGINVESDLGNQHAVVGTSGSVTTTPVDSPTANTSDTSSVSFGPTTYPITRTQ